tara:strand:- start:25 stop:861 length:837 start_codon:yes stop_codon:yes gene_type:complete
MNLLCLAIKKNNKINKYFEKSCEKNNIDYILIDCFIKSKIYDKILENINEINSNKIILIVDYEKTLFLENKSKIIDTFLKSKNNILFSSENEINTVRKYTQSLYNYNSDICYDKGNFSIPSSKFFIGFKDDLIDLLKKIDDYRNENPSSEFSILNKMCDHGYRINIDLKNQIFYNSNNSILFNENIETIQNNDISIKKTLLTKLINLLSSNKYKAFATRPLILCNFNSSILKKIWNHKIKQKKIKIKSNDIFIPYFTFIIFLILSFVIFTPYFTRIST